MNLIRRLQSLRTFATRGYNCCSKRDTRVSGNQQQVPKDLENSQADKKVVDKEPLDDQADEIDNINNKDKNEQLVIRC